MTDTTYVDQSAATPITAAWLNDINVAIYRALGAAGVAPATAAQVIANLGVMTVARLASTAPPSGASLIGYKSSLAGAVAETVQKTLDDYVSVKQFGENVGSGGDDTAAFAAAIAASPLVYMPPGNYLISSTLTLPNYSRLVGAGQNAAKITITTDNVAVVVTSYATLEACTILTSGVHTHNLVEVGSAAVDGGRAVLRDLTVTGAGLDGVGILQGNLGLLQNVTSILNGRDGVNFAAISGDTNNWTALGFLDLRGNIRDGLHVAPGTTLGDSICSKANVFSSVTTQNNGRYGVYLGTRSNILMVYSEANTTADVYLDSFARGNEVTPVNGMVVDASLNPQFNTVWNYNAAAGYQRVTQNRMLFSGVATAGLQIFNDDGATGTVQLNKLGTNHYQLATSNSAAAHTFDFASLDGATTWKFTGLVAVSGGLQLTGAAVAGAAGTITLGNGTAGTVGAAGGAAALPATPLGYVIGYVAGIQVKFPYYNA